MRGWETPTLGPLLVLGAFECVIVLVVIDLKLVQSQSGEFEPVPVLSQFEWEGSACSGLPGPGQCVVILLLVEDQAWQGPQETVGVDGGLLVEVLWDSRDLSTAVAMRHVEVGPGCAVHVVRAARLWWLCGPSVDA